MQRPGVCANGDRVIALTEASQPSGSFGLAAGGVRPDGLAFVPGSMDGNRSPLRVRFTSVAGFWGDAATVGTCRPATKASNGRARPTPNR
jgi:hypothetical protein